MRRTVCTVNQDATPKPSGNIMSKFAIFCCSLLALIMLAVTVDTADAARFGGGRSFGGRSFMSRPATPPASTFNQSRVTRETPQAAAAAQRPGMGGIFGGLLAGTLLGSLFGGMGGGVIGGILNILILGGLVYLAFRLFARLRGARRNTEQESAGPAFGNLRYQTQSPGAGGPGTPRSGPNWDLLSGGGVSSAAPDGSNATVETSGVHVPAGFDTEEFLKGAKAAYARLNAAWDRRDIDDIAEFSTPALVKIIREQAAEDPNPGKTEILLIDAQLVDVREDHGEQMASVFFNVVLREDARQSAPTDVREIWHFVRHADGTGLWKLDGIQQVQM